MLKFQCKNLSPNFNQIGSQIAQTAQPHFASATRSEWQATQAEQLSQSSVHRSLGEGGQE